MMGPDAAATIGREGVARRARMQSPLEPAKALRPALWMLAAAFSFAAMGTLTHALGPRCDWLIVALARAIFMFTATALWARSAGVPLVLWEPRTLWLRSLAGSVSLVGNFYALAKLPPADAITLANAHPLWIVLLTAILLRRPPSPGVAIGVASGLIGVAMIEQPNLAVDATAVGVALLSSLATAVAMLGLHRLRGVDARAVVAHFAGVAAVIASTLLAFRKGGDSPDGLGGVTLLMLLGVAISGTLGQVFLTRAYASGPPSKVAVIGLTQVVIAMAMEAAIWGRTLTPPAFAGFVLVLAPTAWLIARSGEGKGEPSPPAPSESEARQRVTS